MNNKQKEITRIAKEFASGFADTVGDISGSEWLIVDPLSAYLNAIGYTNTITQIPAKDNRPQVLILTFDDGSQFIPAGSDLPHPEAKNWMWI